MMVERKLSGFILEMVSFGMAYKQREREPRASFFGALHLRHISKPELIEGQSQPQMLQDGPTPFAELVQKQADNSSRGAKSTSAQMPHQMKSQGETRTSPTGSRNAQPGTSLPVHWEGRGFLTQKMLLLSRGVSTPSRSPKSPGAP